MSVLLIAILYIIISVVSFVYWETIKIEKSDQKKIVALIFTGLGVHIIARYMFYDIEYFRLFFQYLFIFFIFLAAVEYQIAVQECPSLYYLLNLVIFIVSFILDNGIEFRGALPLFPVLFCFILTVYNILHSWKLKEMYNMISYLFFSLALFMCLYIQVYFEHDMKLWNLCYIFSGIGVLFMWGSLRKWSKNDK